VIGNAVFDEFDPARHSGAVTRPLGESAA
jgi:hypothetical protein